MNPLKLIAILSCSLCFLIFIFSQILVEFSEAEKRMEYNSFKPKRIQLWWFLLSILFGILAIFLK